MAIVHLVMQKKGGVGKSMVSSFWMQYLNEAGYTVYGLDTDPSNKSFAAFQELDVAKLELLDQNDDIDPRRFDTLVDAIYRLDPTHHLIIDTGSSCYPSLYAYLKHNNPFAIIKDGGHQIYIHTPIAGGSDVIETTACLEQLVSTFPDVQFVVWKNRYHGDLVIDDKPFEQFKVYPKIKNSLVATVEIPHKNPATFGKDVELLLAKRHTFKAAANSSLPVMVRQRLSIFWREACEAMSSALVFENAVPVQKAKEA